MVNRRHSRHFDLVMAGKAPGGTNSISDGSIPSNVPVRYDGKPAWTVARELKLLVQMEYSCY